MTQAEEHYNNESYEQVSGCWQKVAEVDDIDTMINFGTMCQDKNDNEKAAEWYSKAAELGDATGLIEFVNLRFDEIVSNRETVTKALCVAAEKWKDRKAMNILGAMYRKKKEYKEAFKWYHKATDFDDTDAMNILGLMYDNGEGVAEDKKEAIKWYRKSAEMGHAEAMYNLGMMYHNGEGSVQDCDEAIKWYRKAAGMEYAAAMNKLGSMYYKGEWVVQNYREAFKWYYKAAEMGWADAMNMLGKMYERGEGVVTDINKSIKWYRRSMVAKKNNERTKENLKKDVESVI